MAQSLVQKWRTLSGLPSLPGFRGLRSDAALEAIAKASEQKVPNVVLYNYPSFSGAFSALFAHLFHTHRDIPCLMLPFSSVEPLRVEDLYIEGIETFYLLDFLHSKDFVLKLSEQTGCKVIGFDHRKSVLPSIPSAEDCPENLMIHVNLGKSSSSAVYEYFSARHEDFKSCDGLVPSLMDSEYRGRVELILKYIEDGDLRRWSLPDIRAFNIGMGEWRSRFNCIANPYMYEQLLELSAEDIIARGKSYLSSRWNDASNLLGKVFKIQLGRGFYGECLGVRADGNSKLSDEIGKLLSMKSAAAGLRPIGAVIFMQRNNLKMCLRSTDSATDTSEIAKVFISCFSMNFLLYYCLTLGYIGLIFVILESEGLWWRWEAKFKFLHNKNG